MAKLSVQEIRTRAKAIVLENPGGIRENALVEKLYTENPEITKGAIRSDIYNLDEIFRPEIIKPSRGLFKPINAVDDESVSESDNEPLVPIGVNIRESELYGPFAEWLKSEGEVVEVAPLGGAGMRSKWGTPDVIGVYKPLAYNLIQFPLEIVSAEIKRDPQAPVVAFGQAVAYRLFSTKTFIVMPGSLSEENKDRLESLCVLFGVGLVLFDANKDDPEFSIRVSAQRFSPDMFYVNEFADRLKLFYPDVFKKLFR